MVNFFNLGVNWLMKEDKIFSTFQGMENQYD